MAVIELIGKPQVSQAHCVSVVIRYCELQHKYNSLYGNVTNLFSSQRYGKRKCSKNAFLLCLWIFLMLLCRFMPF